MSGKFVVLHIFREISDSLNDFSISVRYSENFNSQFYFYRSMISRERIHAIACHLVAWHTECFSMNRLSCRSPRCTSRYSPAIDKGDSRRHRRQASLPLSPSERYPYIYGGNKHVQVILWPLAPSTFHYP